MPDKPSPYSMENELTRQNNKINDNTKELGKVKDELSSSKVEREILKALAEQINLRMKDFISEMKDWRHEMMDQYATKGELISHVGVMKVELDGLKTTVRNESLDKGALKSRLWSVVEYVIFGVMGAILATVLL